MVLVVFDIDEIRSFESHVVGSLHTMHIGEFPVALNQFRNGVSAAHTVTEAF